MSLELQITFKELITDIPKINQNNLFCSIYLAEGPTFIFLSNITLAASNNFFSISDLASKKPQKLQLRLYHSKTFLGSISVPIEEIMNVSPMDFSQWLTLFEDIHDDLYDGDLGENDEDIPKVLIGFSLRLDKARKTRSPEKEANPEREKSPASILKSNTTSQSKIAEKDERRNRGVSFARDVLKKEIVKEADTSIQEIIEEKKEESPRKHKKKDKSKEDNKNTVNVNMLNQEELIRVMNEKCTEALKMDKKKKGELRRISQKDFMEIISHDDGENEKKPEKKEKKEKKEKEKEKSESGEKKEKNREKGKSEKTGKNERVPSKNEIPEKIPKTEKNDNNNDKSPKFGDRSEKIQFNEQKPTKIPKSEEKIQNTPIVVEPKENEVSVSNNKISSEKSLPEKKKKEKNKQKEDNNANFELDADKMKILELEKEISNWKFEFQGKITLVENLKENVARLQGYENKYNDLLKKFEESIRENEENYQKLLEKKSQIDHPILKKSSSPPEKPSIKTSKQAKTIQKEDSNQNQSKISEILSKYQEISDECRQIQEKSHKRDEEQAENIKNLNKSLVESTQKTIDLEQRVELLSHANSDLENEKAAISKNLIKANEHIKLLSKELKEEKIKKLEEIKTLTDQSNEKQLEINKLQNDLEILNRELEISNLKITQYHESGGVKYAEGKGDSEDEKIQRIRDLEYLLQSQKNDVFEKQYKQLLSSMKEENKDLKNLLSQKEQEISKNTKKQFELSEEITSLNNQISTQNLIIQKMRNDTSKNIDSLTMIKKLFPIQNLSYIAQKNDEIDVNMMLFMQDNQIPLKIIRLAEGKYLYGSLKIEVFLEHSKLMVNLNGEASSFEQFNLKHLPLELNSIIQQNLNISLKTEKTEEVPNCASIDEMEINQDNKVKGKKETQHLNKMTTPSKSVTSNKSSSKKSDHNSKSEITDSSKRKK